MPTIKKIKATSSPTASIDPTLYKLLKASTCITTATLLSKGVNPSVAMKRPSAAVAMMGPFMLLPAYKGAPTAASAPPKGQDTFPGAGASVLAKLAPYAPLNYERAIWENLWDMQYWLSSAGCTQMYSPTSLPMTGTGRSSTSQPDTTLRMSPAVWMALAAKQLGLEAHLEIRPAEMVQVGENKPVPAWWIGSEGRQPDLRFMLDLIAPAIGEFFHLLVMSSFVCSKGGASASVDQVKNLLSNSVLVNLASTVRAFDLINEELITRGEDCAFPCEVVEQLKEHLQVALGFCEWYPSELAALGEESSLAEILNTETAIVYGEVVDLLSKDYPEASTGRGCGRRNDSVPIGHDQHWKFKESYNLYRLNNFAGTSKWDEWKAAMWHIAAIGVNKLVDAAFARSYPPQVLSDMTNRYTWDGLSIDSQANVYIEVKDSGAWDLISGRLGLERPAGVLTVNKA